MWASSRFLLLVLLLGGCSRRGPQQAAAQREPQQTAAQRDLGPSPDLLAPASPEPATYVGSRRCQECHGKRHARWARGWHARALSPATAQFVVGDFRGAHFRGASSEAWMRREGDRYVMRTAGPGGAIGDFPVRWVIGGKRMQDTVAELPDGRLQVLPVYFHVTGRGGWVDFTEAKQGALSPEHPFFWTNFRRNANHECLDCHTTGLRVRYDRQARRWSTEMADAGVGCESCHGPGSRHARTEEPGDIVHPGKLDKEAQLALCGSCHGPRKPLYPILDLAHRFRPGQRYQDSYQALVVVDGPQRSGDYFADGRPSSSSYEYQALVQSRCYRIGKAGCLTCHTAPHDEHGPSELRPARGGAPAEAPCRSCHAPIFAAGKRHTRHQAAAAQSCLGCHMPRVVTGVLDRFADHALDVPVPENAARHGVPSACDACHEKMSPEELAQAASRLWPGSAARRARRLRLADAIDEKTAAQSLAPLRAVLRDEAEAPTLRGAAAVLLSQRFPKEVVAVRPLLRHADPLLRQRALEAIGFASARAAVDEVAGLLGDPALAVRHTAALVLGLMGDGRAEAAMARLAADPESEGLPQPHVLLGLAAARRGEVQAAARELERAVALMPYYADALAMLGELYQRQGDAALARARAEEALRFDGQHRGARKLLQQLETPPR